MLPMNPINKLPTEFCEFDPTVDNNWSSHVSMNTTNKLYPGFCEFDPTVGNNWSSKVVHGSDKQAIHKSNDYSQS